MHIQKQVSLRDHSTMRLGGLAAYLADVHDEIELEEALAWAQARDLPVCMIGSGSNIVWRDEGFAGLLLVNKMRGLTIEDEHAGGDTVLVHIAAGEIWDEVVARTVEERLSGIESLSLIPGTAGATPVQNVGAYGAEIKDVLVQVRAYDREAQQFVELPNSACNFGYRTSRFKTSDHGRFFITDITLRLRRGNPTPPFYAALQAYFDEHHIATFTPKVVRDAVIAIRRSKLPDPVTVANNGSFFANPVIPARDFEKLHAQFADLPHWPAGEGRIKIPAAWLLEHAGFKNLHDPSTGMATWPAQPLVLVNEHAEHTADLLAFRQKIIDAVQQKFGITLEQEPELLP